MGTASLRLSYSQIKCFKECKLRYGGKYILKKRGVKDLSKALVGIAVHNGFEKWINSRVWIDSPKEAREALKKRIAFEFTKISHAEHTLSKAELKSERLRALAAVGPLVDGLKEHVLVSRKMDIERSWVIPVCEGLSVYIRPDMVLWRDEDTAILVDGKTTQNKAFLDKEQLYFYTSFLRIAEKIPIKKAGFFLFHSGEFIEVDLGKGRTPEEHIAFVIQVKQKVVELREVFQSAKSIYELGEYANPGAACRFCEFKEECPFCTKSFGLKKEGKKEKETNEIASKLDAEFVTV